MKRVKVKIINDMCAYKATEKVNKFTEEIKETHSVTEIKYTTHNGYNCVMIICEEIEF